MRWNLKHTAGAITPKFKQLSAGRFAKVETAENLDDCGLIERPTSIINTTEGEVWNALK
jgi:hypothetical protein